MRRRQDAEGYNRYVHGHDIREGDYEAWQRFQAAHPELTVKLMLTPEGWVPDESTRVHRRRFRWRKGVAVAAALRRPPVSDDILERLKRESERLGDTEMFEKAVDEIERLRAIVAGLAALDEDTRIYDGMQCIFCGAYYGSMTGPNPRRKYDTHESDCIWAVAAALEKETP